MTSSCIPFQVEIAAMQRELKRTKRPRYKAYETDTDFVFHYEKYQLADFTPVPKW